MRKILKCHSKCEGWAGAVRWRSDLSRLPAVSLVTGSNPLTGYSRTSVPPSTPARGRQNLRPTIQNLKRWEPQKTPPHPDPHPEYMEKGKERPGTRLNNVALTTCVNFELHPASDSLERRSANRSDCDPTPPHSLLTNVE